MAPRPTATASTCCSQFVEGLSFVGHNFVFASLIGLALFNALFGLSYVTLLPIFADVYFGTGSDRLRPAQRRARRRARWSAP